jgi:transposase-like protein
MSYHHNESGVSCDESFKRAAVEFLNSNGSVESAAAELGVAPADLREWKNRETVRRKSPRTLSGVARLRAENEALRSQVLSLQIQWDILRVTLGMLSTTVGKHD